MKSNTKIILSIVFTIISIFFILLSYFEIIRYIQLQYCSSDSYIKAYSNIDPVDQNDRVVITLTTKLTDLNKLKPVINSLLDQTVRVNQILVNIPRNTETQIPNWLTKAVTINQTGQNYGKLGSIIPTLMRECESKTRIIVVDDNVIYGKDFVEKIIESSNEHPNNAIYTKKCDNIEIIETKYGVLIKPEFFKLEDIQNSDVSIDINPWLTNILKKRYINITKVNYNESYKF